MANHVELISVGSSNEKRRDTELERFWIKNAQLGQAGHKEPSHQVSKPEIREIP